MHYLIKSAKHASAAGSVLLFARFAIALILLTKNAITLVDAA
jgi:hypothetical protein